MKTKAEAKKDIELRHDLRHDRHTVSLLTDHLVFSPTYRGKVLEGKVAEVAEENLSLEKKALPKKHRFPQLKEWCPGHLWASSCYHKTFKKSFIKNASQSVEQGWEVVERYISWQKNYCKIEDAVPVVVVDEEKEKTHKIGYIPLYTKFLLLQAPYLKYGVCDSYTKLCIKLK